MEKVLVYYTGGTIGMKEDDDGQRVRDPKFQENMERELADLPVEWDFLERDPLLDSSNMTPKDWLEIGLEIASRYNDYKSFVVLHGTDTMAYTTSALSFMFNGLRKPIIFTGSQIPLSMPGNDARDNLYFSLDLADNYPLEPEVGLFFKDRLMRGCRVTKISAEEKDAFDSPNFPPLAWVIDGRIEFNKQAAMRPAEDADVAFGVQEITHTRVGLLRLFPGISADITRNFLQSPLQGAVVHAYGSGNGPSGDANEEFREVLREAASRGVLVACTQCLHGSVNLNLYETGLGGLGIASGYDMTAEAALTKLSFLLSTGLPLSAVRPMMEFNIKGELTRS